MALIRDRDTKPELAVRKALHAAGLRYRLRVKSLPGKPDIVFRSRRIALFVHGCFWHQHSDPKCRLARMPKTRLGFWRAKLVGNRERDKRVVSELKRTGWRVIEVWECQIRARFLESLAKKIKGFTPNSHVR